MIRLPGFASRNKDVIIAVALVLCTLVAGAMVMVPRVTGVFHDDGYLCKHRQIVGNRTRLPAHQPSRRTSPDQVSAPLPRAARRCLAPLAHLPRQPPGHAVAHAFYVRSFSRTLLLLRRCLRILQTSGGTDSRAARRLLPCPPLLQLAAAFGDALCVLSVRGTPVARKVCQDADP